MTTHNPGAEWDALADLDPVLLASLRTSADEDAIVAALEAQLTRQASVIAAQSSHEAPVIPLRRRARPRTVLRAA